MKYLQFSDPKVCLYRPNPAGDPLVICEGEFDALVLSQLNVDAVTSTGGADSLVSMLDGVRFSKPVYIATDQDDPGEKAAQQLADLFPHALRLHWDGANDVSDALNRVSSPATELGRWIRAAERERDALATGR